MRFAPGFVALLVLAANIAFAQQKLTGELRVAVRDPSGNPLETSLTLETLLTGSLRHSRTDAQGSKTFANLTFGRYRLEISKEGFATQSFLVDVQSTDPVLRTITLALGAIAFHMDVVSTTPLPGSELDSRDLPAPTQSATAREIEESGALELSDFLNRRFGGVNVNEIQGNPFQPDVNFRGYTASPLLGTPQGLSVFMDGVRLNQPFGDVVSWDLIPRIAISEVTLIPGSNPLFGLNALGGAISIQTKDGRSQHGTSIELSGGSFGRSAAELEHGGTNSSGLNWYVGSTLFFENGWREDSPSNVRLFFGKLGWQGTRTTLGVAVSYANNQLNGNGLQEQRFFDRDYASVYTKPDVTRNRSPLMNLTARRAIANNLSVSGNAYYRYISTNAFNGDMNEDSLDQALYQPNAVERAALTAAGYTGFPTSGESASNTPFPFWRCIAQVLLKDEPAEKCNGLLNRSGSRQHNYGLNGQLNWWTLPGGRRNQLTAGAAFDASRTIFRQTSELGYINPDRSITGLNAYADGITGGKVDGEPYDTPVGLLSRTHTSSVFAVDTLSLAKGLVLSVSGRYNRTVIDNVDEINPGAGRGSLDGHHVFQRLNPALGITMHPWHGLDVYASYAEGSRAPTSIELGCADPATPCRLPNALTGDPPLKQVVTRTFEAGVRGGLEERWNWNAGWFRADNHEDILFVSSPQSGFGYFKNFGSTRRQGMKLEINMKVQRLSFGGSYTLLDSTFQSREEVNGSSNSSNADGRISIERGSQIPLIPRHAFKAFSNIHATEKLSFDLGWIAFSGAFARGNENNLHEPDGQYYLGSGRSPGYAVVNFSARYAINRQIECFAQINNLFDTQYYSAAQLGVTGFTESGNFVSRPLPPQQGEFPLVHATFYAPGAPFGAWGGLRITF